MHACAGQVVNRTLGRTLNCYVTFARDSRLRGRCGGYGFPRGVAHGLAVKDRLSESTSSRPSTSCVFVPSRASGRQGDRNESRESRLQ